MLPLLSSFFFLISLSFDIHKPASAIVFVSRENTPQGRAGREPKGLPVFAFVISDPIGLRWL
jgi:hypothetical protein